MHFTDGEWQSWFCQFLGAPLPSMVTLRNNNRRCPCSQHPLYDVHGDHISTCANHMGNRTRAHNHVLACLESIFRDAGYHARTKNVPRIELRDVMLHHDLSVVSDNLGIVVHEPLPLPRLVPTPPVGTDGAVVVVPGGRVAIVGAGAAAVRGEREKQLEWKRVQEEKQSAFEDEEFVDRDPDLE